MGWAHQYFLINKTSIVILSLIHFDIILVIGLPSVVKFDPYVSTLLCSDIPGVSPVSLLWLSEHRSVGTRSSYHCEYYSEQTEQVARYNIM